MGTAGLGSRPEGMEGCPRPSGNRVGGSGASGEMPNGTGSSRVQSADPKRGHKIRMGCANGRTSRWMLTMESTQKRRRGCMGSAGSRGSRPPCRILCTMRVLGVHVLPHLSLQHGVKRPIPTPAGAAIPAGSPSRRATPSPWVGHSRPSGNRVGGSGASGEMPNGTGSSRSPLWVLATMAAPGG
jgi:hypothetical protein